MGCGYRCAGHIRCPLDDFSESIDKAPSLVSVSFLSLTFARQLPRGAYLIIAREFSANLILMVAGTGCRFGGEQPSRMEWGTGHR